MVKNYATKKSRISSKYKRWKKFYETPENNNGVQREQYGYCGTGCGRR